MIRWRDWDGAVFSVASRLVTAISLGLGGCAQFTQRGASGSLLLVLVVQAALVLVGVSSAAGYIFIRAQPAVSRSPPPPPPPLGHTLCASGGAGEVASTRDGRTTNYPT